MVPHGGYLYSDVALFTAADKSAHATLMHDTNLSLNGSWTIDSTNTAADAEVTSLAGVVTGTSVRLTWVDPTNADFDHISITHNQTGGNTPVLVAKGLQTSLFTGLTAGTAYIFTVKTVSTKPVSSTGVTVTKTPADVVAPADCTFPNASRTLGVITLSWIDSVAVDLDHVEITHDQAGGSTPIVVAAGVQTKALPKLPQGVTYTYTIKAVDAAGNKSAGVHLIASPYGDVTAPANPTGSAGTNGSLRSVLTWVDPVAADFDHIEITHDQTGGTTPVIVAAGVQTATITGLPASTLCTFTLKSVDVNGNKSAGATTTATPTA